MLRKHRQIVSLVLLSCFSFAAKGQTPGTGAISGTIRDTNGREISGASIHAESVATHAGRTVQSEPDGTFRIPVLAPGSYQIYVESAGLEASAFQVVVTASDVSSVRVVMHVAPTKQSITVEGTTSALDLESPTLGGLVDGTAVSALPLSSRNYTQILGLQPGVIADLPTPASLGNGTQNVAVQGATPTANNIQFNGMDANNLMENSAASAQNFQVGTPVPAPDTIQEFRVQTANYDAAYGRGSGANIDLVSRAGSNAFHGSVWEFARNNIFNANHFFGKAAGQPRPDLKQHQFGVAAGGPLQRDRLHLFTAFQGTRQINGLGTSRSATLPLLGSDRSAATLGAQFCPATHLNSGGQPSNGYQTTVGGMQVACDGSNINPVALAILNAKLPNGQYAVPAPQAVIPAGPGDPGDQLPIGFSSYSPSAHYDEDQWTLNLDERISPKNELAQRFFYSKAKFQLPFSPNGANVPGWGTNADHRNTLFVLTDTHVFRSNLVNVTRVAFTRFNGLSAVENPFTAAQFGLGTPTGTATSTANMPAISIGGFTIGDGGTPSNWSVTNSLHAQETVAWTHGRHSMRAGAEYKHHQVFEDQPQQKDGFLFFSSFPDFLIGRSASDNGSPLGLSNVSLSVAGGGIFRRDEIYNDFAAFAQDDIHFSSRFTVNAGLRYEIFGAPWEAHGRLTNYDPGLGVQGILPASGTLRGYTVSSNYTGVVPDGVTKTSYKGFYRTPHLDFSPRLGFAWQMSNSPVFVLRGGFGVYYDRHSANLPETMLGQAPYALSQFNAGPPNAPASLQSGFVPLVPPSSSFPVFQPLVNFGFPFLQGINPNIKDGRTYEYNLNVQYEVGKNSVLQMGYVGTQSVHRPGQYQFDQALLAAPGSPVNGETQNTRDNAFLRMPYQGMSPGSLLTDSVFSGNFNALELNLSRHAARGLQYQVSYTWSKNLDMVNGEGGLDVFELQLPTNDQHDLRGSSYGPTGSDRAHRLVANFVWEPPAVTSLPFMARAILNGWRFAGIGLVQSGAALSVFDGNAGSVYGLLSSQTRAQLAPSGKIATSGSLYSRVAGGRYLNPSAFMRAPQAPNSSSIADEDFGNSGVGIVRGPGQHSIDLAVERKFPMSERASFTFRAEAFNLTNTPQFGNPNTNLGYGNPLQPEVASPDFGLVLNEQGGPHPRVVQLAARVSF